MAKKDEPKEKTIQTGILRWLKKQKYTWCLCHHGSQFSKMGVPDIQVIYEGRALWLEVKRPSGKVTAIQAYVHEELRAVGSVVCVVRSVDEAKRAFAEFVLNISREDNNARPKKPC